MLLQLCCRDANALPSPAGIAPALAEYSGGLQRARPRRSDSMNVNRKAATVVALGSAQTLAWASSYYLPAVLAAPMARDLGVTTPTVFAAFSTALLVSAALGPHAGAGDRSLGRPGRADRHQSGLRRRPARARQRARAVGPVRRLGDPRRRHGQRPVRGGIRGAGAAVRNRLAQRHHRHHADRRIREHRRLAAVGAARKPRRLARRVFQLGGAAPRARHPAQRHDPARRAAARRCPRRPRRRRRRRRSRSSAPARLLALAFAATWFISTAMAAHLPRLLQASGATLAAAVAIGALVGPAQVAGRVLEFGLLRRIHPLFSARAAALTHPLGAALLALFGAPAAVAFALLHGAGNGILTIAKGTLPLVLFGPHGYGRRQGWLMVPARIAQALAPWLFGILPRPLGRRRGLDLGRRRPGRVRFALAAARARTLGDSAGRRFQRMPARMNDWTNWRWNSRKPISSGAEVIKRRRGDDRPVDALVGRREHLQADRQRPGLDRVGDDQRPEEVVPVVAHRAPARRRGRPAAPAARRPCSSTCSALAPSTRAASIELLRHAS